MTSIEETKEMLRKAEVQTGKADAVLVKFKKENEGLLAELRRRLLNKQYEDEEERGLWIKEKDELIMSAHT